MSLRVNTLANFGGRIWTAALGALLIPFYVKFLGIEAYALVGVSGSLFALFGLLDLGMAAAFARELARLEEFGADSKQDERDLLATFDIIYGALAVVTLALILLIAPYIATKWVTAQSLDSGSILLALRLIAVSAAFQLPTSFYFGGLLGIERQVLYNVLSISAATIRGFGAIAVLYFFGGTVFNFFGWQALIAAATAIAAGLTLHRIVDRGEGRGRFRFDLVKSIWRYAAGWLTNSLGSNLAGQIDKVILSRILPLAQFGYYTLASTVALLLWNLVVPVSSAALPRFNRSIATNNEERLRHDYFNANQLLALVLFPLSAVVMTFPRHVMMLWTRDATMATATQRLVVVFAAGMLVAGLSNVALHLALAYGRFHLPVLITAGATLIAAPIMIFGGKAWGALGGAIGWALQIGSVIVLVPLLHRRSLRGEWPRWLLYNLVLPALGAGGVCALAWFVRPDAHRLIPTALFLFATWFAASVAVASIEPDLRASAAALFRGEGFAAALKGETK